MSEEKKFLITHDEFNAIRESKDNNLFRTTYQLYRFLEDHEYKERTCHMDIWSGVSGRLISECDMCGEKSTGCDFNYCPYCGAKVVEE